MYETASTLAVQGLGGASTGGEVARCDWVTDRRVVRNVAEGRVVATFVLVGAPLEKCNNIN